MLTEKVQQALNEQINAEFVASYNYLGMACYLKNDHWHGFAKWMEAQSAEEYGHAMRLYAFLTDNGVPVTLHAIPAPVLEFASVRAVFEDALKQESDVTRRIHALYDLAQQEKAYAALIELQWFVTEQVEEERTFRGIVARLRMIGDDLPAMVDLDNRMGEQRK